MEKFLQVDIYLHEPRNIFFVNKRWVYRILSFFVMQVLQRWLLGSWENLIRWSQDDNHLVL